jgi:glycosyltransferase involved in cell wall biosynthesis
MSKGQMYGGPAALMARTSAVWYQLGFPERTHLESRIATVLPARGILALSPENEASQLRLWPKRRVKMVFPGAELKRFDPSTLPEQRELRARFGIPVDAEVVGIVGRLQRWKGMHTLVSAFVGIVDEFPNAVCLIVGGEHAPEPEYPAELRRLADRLGLADHVRFAGLQPNVPEWMRCMDVVVHASNREPFGIVVVEAMAMGQSVIAGSAGGPSQIITDGRDGLLVDYEDVPGLEAAVRRLLRDPQLRSELGSAARDRAQDFSSERYAEGVLEALRAFTDGESR